VYWHVPGWSADEILREGIEHVRTREGPGGEQVEGWGGLVGMTDLEPLDGLIVRNQMKNFQRGLESTPRLRGKTQAERAREAEMNKIL
jgi:hypothetical protein